MDLINLLINPRISIYSTCSGFCTPRRVYWKVTRKIGILWRYQSAISGIYYQLSHDVDVSKSDRNDDQTVMEWVRYFQTISCEKNEKYAERHQQA